ncbi:hypothetical protein [Actinokineospora globicatena]|uniref:hypothetical protein n=1 Tax=Actinokineospora globicatena TaxID=103729 RepID=UPI0020A56264|nr:hypothetical protein [Actinokineospora globicatena]MCP2306899.1 hypothetical protein [Actinokineospora globicatena]GLW82342.1 hypothetical protein Aglo01_68230 [Actinokineospora globicatena]GLW89065.1 hypothetical protein Aglo02_67040 [Actinokineospora globicatena]
MGYSQLTWERAAAAVAARAVREVPFYRERHARGLGLAPVPVAEVAQRLWALCPLSSPHRPAAEPTLWTGDPRDLATGLLVAGVSGASVLEVRSALVPWTRLGALGPRYAPVLSPSADAVDLSASDGPARAMTAAGETVLVSPPEVATEVAARVGHTGVIVRRLTTATDMIGPAVLHDRHLGYFAARPHGCGSWHVLWRRFHVAAGDGGVLVTALRRRRPTLVRVLVDVGLNRVGVCREHGRPVLQA